MTSTIKILISQKKYSKLLRSEIFTPIQTGAAISDVRYDDMLHDDTGENISDKNDFFCELTAIYWAWKNYDKLGNPDYIGFMHNRRHFIFNEKEYKINKWGLVEFTDFNEDYLEACSLDDESVRSLVENWDAVLPIKINVGKTIRDQYKSGHNEKDFDMALQVLCEMHPEYSHLADEYSKSMDGYYLLMGIYKRDLFFRYCEWLFDLLFKLFDRIDYTGYTPYQARVCGFLAERLTGIFYLKLAEEGLRLHHLNVAMLMRAESLYARYNPMPCPVFQSGETCVVAMASNNNYVPYLTTTIESIRRHASPQHNYDLIVFERDISEFNKEIIQRCYSHDNISVRFYNPCEQLKGINLYLPIQYISQETYFRLLVPAVLEAYNKVLYIDIDLVLRDDIYNLFSIELGNHPIACAKDYVYAAMANIGPLYYDYSIETLKLESPYDYYNAGVLLMNNDYFRTHGCTQELLELVNQNKYHFSDQCALNTYFRGHILELPTEWNYFAEGQNWDRDRVLDYVPLLQLNQAKAARKNPKIIHYAGPCKPWLNSRVEFADIYMQYAKDTPFFSNILQAKFEDALRARFEDVTHKSYAMAEGNMRKSEAHMRDMLSTQYVLEHRTKYFARYLLYCIKYALFRKMKYKVKKSQIKQQLREARLLSKQLRRNFREPSLHPRRKYLYYKLMSKITWGKRRRRYKEKRRMMKYLIKTMV